MGRQEVPVDGANFLYDELQVGRRHFAYEDVQEEEHYA